MNAKDATLFQLRSLFFLDEKEEILIPSNCFDEAEKETIKSIKPFNEKHFNGIVNPMISMVYCQYLYRLSRILSAQGCKEVADKVFYLNKTLNACDLFYEIDLPEHWCCAHPIGSVMGRAFYGDFFYFHQGCTIGQNRGGDYPIVGDNVIMFANATVLGNSVIGNNVIIAANALVIDEEIPDNSVVFGVSPNLIIKEKRNDEMYLV